MSLLRMTTTFIIAITISYFFSFSEKFWIPLAALLAMLTPIGSVVYNGIRWLVLMILVVIVGSWMFSDMSLTYVRVIDVTIGSIIGILANLFLFPRRPDVEFRRRMVLILNAYSEYLDSLIHSFFHKKHEEPISKRIYLENLLRKDFPDWVFKTGYNIALRSGHRFFAATISKMSFLLFSMHQAVIHTWDADLKNQLEIPMQNLVSRAREIISTINIILELKQVVEKPEDFFDDIKVMEVILKKKIRSLELLSLSDADIYPESVLFDLKDFHTALIKLIETLR